MGRSAGVAGQSQDWVGDEIFEQLVRSYGTASEGGINWKNAVPVIVLIGVVCLSGAALGWFRHSMVFEVQHRPVRDDAEADAVELRSGGMH